MIYGEVVVARFDFNTTKESVNDKITSIGSGKVTEAKRT